MHVIEVENLVKDYGAIRAVKGICFKVAEGAMFAFLGENGARKPTTVEILCSILRKTSGKAHICGFDLDREAELIKPKIGVAFQRGALDELLTVKENLAVRASYYGLKGAEFASRLATLTEELDLEEFLNRPYGKLSGGQKRRADIARALANMPRILILDEPTTGLDPQSRKNAWSAIRRLRRERGMTVFFSTHCMEEANESDDVVILDEGKIVAQGAPAELKRKYSSTTLSLYGDAEKIRAALVARGIAFDDLPGRIRPKLESSEEIRMFLAKNADISQDFEVKKGNMDDAFLAATGKAGGMKK